MCIKYAVVCLNAMNRDCLPPTPVSLRAPEVAGRCGLCCSIFSFLCNFFVDRCLSLSSFILVIGLSLLLEFTASDCTFGIFKLFLLCPCCSFLVFHVCSIWLWRNLVIVLGNMSSKRYKLLVMPEPLCKDKLFWHLLETWFRFRPLYILKKYRNILPDIERPCNVLFCVTYFHEDFRLLVNLIKCTINNFMKTWFLVGFVLLDL